MGADLHATDADSLLDASAGSDRIFNCTICRFRLAVRGGLRQYTNERDLQKVVL